MTKFVAPKPIDRVAAANFIRAAWHLFWPKDPERAMQDARDIEAGRCDNWLLVQAFTRHRIAEQERCLAAIKGELLEDPTDAADDQAYDNAIRDAYEAVGGAQLP